MNEEARHYQLTVKREGATFWARADDRPPELDGWTVKVVRDIRRRDEFRARVEAHGGRARPNSTQNESLQLVKLWPERPPRPRAAQQLRNRRVQRARVRRIESMSDD